ncbi:hypothetical protein ACHAXS_010780 [Conticribra weissflogii]
MFALILTRNGIEVPAITIFYYVRLFVVGLSAMQQRRQKSEIFRTNVKMGLCHFGAFHIVIFLLVALTQCSIEIDARNNDGNLRRGNRPWVRRHRQQSSPSILTTTYESTQSNRICLSEVYPTITPGISARGGAINILPAGYNPFGYGLTDLGRKYLEFNGSLESDVGQFLSTLKSGKRKTSSTLKEQWLEIVRVSKKGQSMRIYKRLDEFIDFCLSAGFID